MLLCHSCQPSQSCRDTHDMKAPVPLPPDGRLCLLLVPTEQTWLNLSQVKSESRQHSAVNRLAGYTKMGVVLGKWAWHVQKFQRAYRSVPLSSLEKMATMLCVCCYQAHCNGVSSFSGEGQALMMHLARQSIT